MPTAPPIHRAIEQREAWAKLPGADDLRGLSGRPWRRVRDRIMRRDSYLCQTCRRRGKIVAATEVDHVLPVAQGGTDHPDNLAAICKRCHGIKTALEGQGSSITPTWLPTPACPVTLVTGPPGSGKTTYARSHATSIDTVIDLDDCFTDVCGVHGHTADRKYLAAAIRWRNKQLADLAEKRTGQAYFIVGAPTAKECDFWLRKLNAAHIRLNPGIDVCLARVDLSRAIAVRRWYDSQRS